MSTPALRFQASGQPGPVLDATRWPLRTARKREVEVAVEIATQAGRLQTLEGEVQVRAGDALITGLQGERWRVSPEHFAAKYRPTGAPGRYISRPYEVQALRLNAPCEVLLSDGQSTLRGHAGDWLLDYGDGSLGIVAAHLFDMTYELL